MSEPTPETARALVAILDRTGTLFNGSAPEELVHLCRKLERQRDELLEELERTADDIELYLDWAKRHGKTNSELLRIGKGIRPVIDSVKKSKLAALAKAEGGEQ